VTWRRTLLVAEVALVGLLGAVLALLVAGSRTTGVGPFEARLTLRPGWGGTEVSIPPLGELSLRTHSGPLHLQVEVVRLRERAARDLVNDPDRLVGLGQEAQRDLEHGLKLLLLQAGAVTVLGAAALGLLVFRRPGRTAIAGAAGVTALVVAGGWTYATFDRAALLQPRYSGLLAAAPTAIGDVRDIVNNLDLYSQQLGRLVSNVSALYTVTSSLPTFTPGDDTVRLLHVSDLHLSPSAYGVIRSVVRQFDVDAVVDTGDLTDFGSEPESRYLDGIRTLGVPYVYIRGNHDSARTEQGVRNRGGTVLDGTGVVTVAGIRFLGSPDPRFTPDDTTRDDQEPPEVVRAQGRLLAASIEVAPVEPDVVLVHDPIAAEPLRGVTPLVLAGHTHRRKATTEQGTLLLTEGSTGGAGLRGLEGEEPTPLELSVLYLDRTTHRLQAYDAITLGGLGASSARIERTAVDAATPTPSPVPSPSTSPSPVPSPAAAPSPS
jgi:predicted phosphodiesterase